MKKKLAALLAATMLVFAGGCSASTSTSTPSKEASTSEETSANYTVDKMTITYVESPLNVPSIVEKAQGAFAKAYKAEGLDVEYADIVSGADQTAALASGDVQILNAVGGTSLLLSAANGADIKIIGMYSTSPKAFRLFSKNGDINSPEDLRGKNIAGPKGTILHELLVAYLAKGGMTLDDVNFVDMGIPESMAAVEGGSVDAALLAGPVAYKAEKAGLHMVTDGDGLVDATIVTATSQEFYDENPKLVKIFADTQKEILDYIENNHAEAMKMAQEATGLEAEAVEDMYKLYDFHSELTDKDLAGLQKTADFMKNSGLIDTEVDVKALPLDMK